MPKISQLKGTQPTQPTQPTQSAPAAQKSTKIQKTPTGGTLSQGKLSSITGKTVNTTANRQVSAVNPEQRTPNTQPMTGQHQQTIQASQDFAKQREQQIARDNKTMDLLGDTTGKSITDLYLGASSRTGGATSKIQKNPPTNNWNSNLSSAYNRVVEMYDTEVAPALEAYNQAMADYKAGRLDYDSALKAYDNYVAIQSQYDPLQRAFETLRHSNGTGINDQSTLEDAQNALNYWDATINASEKNLNRMGEELDQMKKDYDAAMAAYEQDKSQENVDRVNELLRSIQRMSGEYNAAMFVYQEMGGEYNSLVDNYEKIETKYYEDNPQLLRSSDTAKSIHDRFAPIKEEYERLSNELAAMDKADKESIIMNQRATPGSATDPRRKEIEDRLNEISGMYNSMRWLDDWATEENLAIRDRWENFGWTWQERYDLYKDYRAAAESASTEEDRKRYNDQATEVLNELTNGYGLFVATQEETDQLVADLRDRFDTAKEELRLSVDTDYTDTSKLYQEDRDILAEYKDMQSRLHNLGETATRAEDIAGAVGMMVATDYGSILRAFTEPAEQLLDHIGLPVTAQLLHDANAVMKADRERAQRAMQTETRNMPYVAQMSLNLLPSLIECLVDMGLSTWAAGAGAAQGITRVAGATYADGMASSLEYAQRAAETTSNLQSLLTTSHYALNSIAQNPMYWSSFARTAGADFVSVLDERAANNNGQYTNKDLIDALTYAFVNGSLNAIIEVGGISDKGGFQSLPFLDEAEKSKTFMQAFLKRLNSMKEEGWEEVNQGIMERALQVAMLDKEMPLFGVGQTNSETGEREEAVFSFLQALEEFAGGAAIGGIVGSGGMVREMASIAAQNRIDRLANKQYLMYVQGLNLANMSLPEDLRMQETLDAETCTSEELMNFALNLSLRSSVAGILSESEKTNQESANTEETKTREQYYEQLFEKAKQENPDVTILNTVANELQEKGYGDARGAQVQGELISKILNGETLTKEETSALELNNPTVRSVFIDRTGLTGMPKSADLTATTKKTYVEAAVKLVQRVKANQRALAEGAVELMEAQQAQSEQQTIEKLEAEKPVTKSRKGNKAARENRVTSTYTTLVEEARRKDPIRTIGRDATSILDEVRQRSGVGDLMFRRDFAEALANPDLWTPELYAALSSAEGLDTAYTMYLEGLGLSRAEVMAMVTASSIDERSTNNGEQTEGTRPERGDLLRRDTGGRELDGDVLERTEPVSGGEGQSEGRESEAGREEVTVGSWGSAEALGIPTGRADGDPVRELTRDEIKANPIYAGILDHAKEIGISPDNVHLVEGRGLGIAVRDPNTGKNGNVRGLYNPATQSIWITVDDLRYSAGQIWGHESMHHICRICPELVEQVKGLVQTTAAWTRIEKVLRNRAGVTYNTITEDRIFEEMLCDANGSMDQDYLRDLKDLVKQLRSSISEYLLTAPDDMIAASPEVQEALQVAARIQLEASNLSEEVKYSAIKIPNAAKDEHHDTLGRKLSKMMDKFMANSYMRTDQKKFMPLKVMYRGGGMRREILGSTETESAPLVFWSDRPEIARTYSAEKPRVKPTITHGQEHTKARKRISELNAEYIRLRQTSTRGMSQDESEKTVARRDKRMAEIEKELRALHDEVEPFSKDIYAPQRDKNVWPEKPKTFEEAEALIKRFGAYNRKADLVKVGSEEFLKTSVRPLFEEAKKRLERMVQFFDAYTKAQESVVETEEPDPEDILGAPPWAEEEEEENGNEVLSNGLPAWANLGIPGFLKAGHEATKAPARRSDSEIRAEIVATAKDALDAVANVQPDSDISDLYDAFESLGDITDSLVSEFLQDYDVRSDEAANIRSAYFKDSTTSSFHWSDVSIMTAAVYNVAYSDAPNMYALDVKGLGIKKVFTSQQDVVTFASKLVDELGRSGIYSCYLNITKPVIIDCKGLVWAELMMLNDPVIDEVLRWRNWQENKNDPDYNEEYDMDYSIGVGTDDIGEWAREQVDKNGQPKYDGVILVNIVDTFGISNMFNFGGDASSTVAITWNANTAKSTANAQPTNDPRISYSMINERSDTDE